MRHRKRRTKLSMMGARRKATLKNMVKSLFEHERIETILARAKEARRVAEPLITMAKSDTVAARRRAYAVLGDRDVVGKLFKEIVPLFKNRNSGYTRIIATGFRRGDGASMALLELTEKTIVEKITKKKKEKSAVPETKSEIHKGKNAETGTHEPKSAVTAPKGEHKADELKQKAPAPKVKPTTEDERRMEKAKSEDRKITDKRGFMKNIHGLFKKRGDR